MPDSTALEAASSPSRKRFKQATGLALIDYVLNLRIEEAKRLLDSSDQDVDEICFAVGYEDASFFRRLFRRRTGVAPARYRRVFRPIHRGMPAVPEIVPAGSPHRTSGANSSQIG